MNGLTIQKKDTEDNMKNLIGPILLGLLFMLLFGWAVGGFAHWFYYNAMIVMSKMVFGLMFGGLALIILGLIYAAFIRKRNDQQ